MSSERNIAEEEALKSFGAIKSNYALIDLAASQIENRLLNDDEVLNDNPASFTNIFLENFGRLTSQSFFEQMMYKNEMLPSTAIKTRSIVNKMKSDDIANIYAYPAHMTFVLGYNYDVLIDLASKNGNQVVINKNSKFTMEGQEVFTLDHNIIIKLVNPGTVNQNIYAIYDTSTYDDINSKFSEVNNRYITSQIFQYNGTKVFGIFINARQMERTETVINITSENPDFQIPFNDQLYGFELFYKSLNSTKYVFKEGLFDGNLNPNGYNFELDLDENIINFSFNRTPSSWKPSIGDEIIIVTYTTKGKKGNFNIPNIYELYDQLIFEYAQDRDDPQQDCLVFTDPYVSIKDTGATGGKDSLSFNEIKNLAIQRGSNSSILTPGDLERRANNLGFSVKKIRNDARCLEYRASGILEDLPDIILSRDCSLSFDFNDIPLNEEVLNRLITPKMVFEMNSGNICEYKKNPESYSEYFEHFRKNEKEEYMFPYHIKFIANNEIKANVFNMNRNNEIYNLNFLYYNQNTSFESSILNVSVNRNTITEDINDIPKKLSTHSVGYYDIAFQVTTSSIVIDNLLDEDSNDIVKYKLTITDSDNKEFLVDSIIKPEDIDKDNNTLIVHAYIRTDDAISSSNKLLSRDFSIQPIPYVTNPIEFYALSDKVSVKIYVIEKAQNDGIYSGEYASVLNEDEQNENYFVSTVYGIDNVIIFEDYSEYITLPSDVSISQKEYQRFESDVYKTYEKDIFVTDETGNILTEILKIKTADKELPVTISKILHKKGSFVYKEKTEMPLNTLKTIAKIINENDQSIDNKTILQLAESLKLEVGELTNEELIIYLNKFLNMNYVIEHDDELNYDFLKNQETNEYLTDLIKDQLQDKINSYREKILIHHAGDINISGTLLKDETYKAILKKVPMYNRIYALGNGYEKILKAYDNLISNIKSLQSVKPDGATMSLGIKNTSGNGEYEVYNMNISSWQKIDNISLSFDIGVKYSVSANNDKEADNQVIIETIRDYINNFDDISFGINSIFDIVKSKLPSIEYMILYKINQYSPAEVQSIRKANDEPIVSDKLCVKQVVDIDNTNLDNGIVAFKPDIIIRNIL